jgi:lipoprotein-releasing system permease protein
LNFPLFAAKRYLFAKKKHNAVNVITGISVLGVVVATAALIISLSVFNGFQDLFRKQSSTFDPDIKILPVNGKVFDKGIESVQTALLMQEIEAYSYILEEDAMFKYRGKEYIATLKGVDNNFSDVSGLDTMMYEGDFMLKRKSLDFAVIGGGVAYHLGVQLNLIDALKVYVPDRFAKPGSNPRKAFRNDYLILAGTYRVTSDIDSKYVIAPIGFVSDILGYNNKVSAIEIKLKADVEEAEVSDKLESVLGESFRVLNRYQQQESVYAAMRAEKLMIFVILIFILVIATFNIIGSTVMLIIEKKDNILTLFKLGMTKNAAIKLFAIESSVVIFSGSLLGLLLGLMFCFIQQEFGIISLSGDGGFLVDNYPVKVLLSDIIIITLCVNIVGTIICLLPIRVIIRRIMGKNAVVS